MNSPNPSLSPAPANFTFACIRCSERKVRCDKQSPCNACTRHNVQCIFRPHQQSRRKRKLVNNESLGERLRRYEALLQQNGIDPEQVTSTSEVKHRRISSQTKEPETIWQMPTPAASTVSGPQATIFKPQLLHGQRGTKLVDNSLWSRVAKEIHDAEDAPEGDLATDASDEEMFDDDCAYILGWKTSFIVSSHPPAEVIHQLWQIFIENVNPLTKLVHVPSLQPAIEKAVRNIEHIPKGFEALMFAIYSVATLSLTKDECNEMLGETRAVLLPRYVAATKAALSRAKFMSSTSIVVLQALVLHILSIRDTHEPRAVWSLTGVAIRVAEIMGMHLDGSLLGLSPFETEIRRRIWWQLKMHDFRAAELSGQAKFRDFELDETTPRKPANINDSDLHPAMPQAAVESIRPTEMLWCVFRSDLANFAATQKVRVHKQGKPVIASEEYAAMDDLSIKESFIEKMEDMIETKYLRFCDPSQPLQLLTLLGARSAVNLIRFMAHHPRRWTDPSQVPVSERQLVWSIVIQLLERYSMMQSNPQLRRFAWSVPYFIQWQAVIHVLDTLRADPLHLDAAKAWGLIDGLYERNSDMLLSTKKPILVAVGNLCLRAFNARTAALTKEKRELSHLPDYICKLKEQREVARARSKDQGTVESGRKLNVNADSTRPDMDSNSLEGIAEAQPQQSSVAKPKKNPVQGSTRTWDDAFWLGDVPVDDHIANRASEMVNIDTDVMLAQDYWLDTADGETIDWAQWDAWLGNLNPMQTTFGAGPE